jgi:hypothetical protein
MQSKQFQINPITRPITGSGQPKQAYHQIIQHIEAKVEIDVIKMSDLYISNITRYCT